MVTAQQATGADGLLLTEFWMECIEMGERGHGVEHVEGSHTDTGEGKGNGGYSNKKDRLSSESAIKRQRLIDSFWSTSNGLGTPNPEVGATSGEGCI